VAAADPTARRELPPVDERGRTVVADAVVRRIATIAAREVDDVVVERTGLDRITGRGLPHADVVVAGQTSRVSVEVATRWPAPLSTVTAAVQDHVRERVSTLTGMTVTAVDVRVASVSYGRTARRRVE